MSSKSICSWFRGRSGFTLVELLAVVVIIAMLLGIAVTAAQWAFRTARVKRYQMTCRVLEAAVHRYRHEYKRWPIPQDKNGNPDSRFKFKDPKDPYNDYKYKFSGTDNGKCLAMLRSSHGKNPKRIPFLDESGLFVEKDGKMIPLVTAGDGEDPFVYRNRRNTMTYYSVTIDVEAEKVGVE